MRHHTLSHEKIHNLALLELNPLNTFSDFLSMSQPHRLLDEFVLSPVPVLNQNTTKMFFLGSCAGQAHNAVQDRLAVSLVD
jgi:hypothetical protein